MNGSYKCSCGATCTTEWCHKCHTRNTTKWRASRHYDTSKWSSKDYSYYNLYGSWSEGATDNWIKSDFISDSSASFRSGGGGDFGGGGSSGSWSSCDSGSDSGSSCSSSD
jgi:uncharacterized membrane protein YgcG